jgi:hypothetical protein
VDWFRRDIGWGSFAAEQERFADLFLRLGTPRGMMMFCKRSAAMTIIYIASDPQVAALYFPDFQPTEMPPRDAMLLVGHDEDGATFRWGITAGPWDPLDAARHHGAIQAR